MGGDLSRTARDRAHQEAVGLAGLALAVSSLLAVAKVTLGVLWGSHAVLASSLYSLNDALSSVAVVISLRLGLRRPTERYSYGYGKAEYITVGIVSLVITFAVICMAVFSLRDLTKGVAGPPPHYTAISLPALSAILGVWLGRREHQLAAALDSPTLATGSGHQLAGAAGSVAALLGVAGALAGWPSLDRLASLGQSLHLVALSGALMARATKGLMDVALPVEDTRLVLEACQAVVGVQRVESVRSRLSGSTTFLDLVVAVPADLSVAAAHEIRGRVEQAICRVLGPGTAPLVRFRGPALDSLPTSGGGPRD